jgi:hypothetical protein
MKMNVSEELPLVNDLKLSPKLAGHPRAGCSIVPFLLAGFLATSASADVIFTNLYSFTGASDGGSEHLDR